MTDINKYNGHPMFYKILDELALLHSVKNRQYANKETPFGNFTRTGDGFCKKLINPNIDNKALATALMYMAKQVDGVYDMVGEAKKDTPDELEDKLKDIAVYSIIGIILCREAKMAKPKILKRLVGQLERKGMSPGKASAIAISSLQKSGNLKPHSTVATSKGVSRGNMTPAARAKDRASKQSGKSKSAFTYNAKTNRATLKKR